MAPSFSEVESGPLDLDPRRRHRVDVALSTKDVGLALQFDLRTVLRVVENAIADLHLPHVPTDRHHRGPGQTLADAGCRRDHQAPTGLTFSDLILGRGQHTVVQHLDGQPLLARGCALSHGDGDGAGWPGPAAPVS